MASGVHIICEGLIAIVELIKSTQFLKYLKQVSTPQIPLNYLTDTKNMDEIEHLSISKHTVKVEVKNYYLKIFIIFNIFCGFHLAFFNF